MAEVVNKILESMVPELEELERAGLFSEDEVRSIVKRRREMEYRMFRRPAVKQDFLRAIQYELNLDKLKKQRKERRGVATISKEGEYGVTGRIHTLFRRALKRFKGDTKLWLQYIAFCRQLNQNESLSRVFGKVLAIHPTHTGLWIMAAKFEFEELKDVAAARALLQQGLRVNSTTHQLWHEYFRMELLHTEKLRKRRSLLRLDVDDEEVSDEVLWYKVATIVYNQGVLAVPDDIEFRLKFLPILRLFDGTDEREEDIFQSIKKDFGNHPLFWDALAQRDWARRDNKELPDDVVTKLESDTERIYSEGLKSVGQDGVELLWEKLLSWCVERLHAASNEALSARPKSALDRLVRLSLQCADQQALTETMAQSMVDMLLRYGLTENALSISKMATLQYPSSPTVWITRIQCETAFGKTGEEKEEEKRVTSLFREAISKVSSKVSMPLWRYWITYLISIGAAKDSIHQVYKECISTVSSAVKEEICKMYIEWCLMEGGIKSARRAYKSMLSNKPVPCSVYTMCIELERNQKKPCMERLSKLFEAGLEEYGETSPDLWLDYIKVEMTVEGGRMDKVSELHWRATKTLDGSLTAQFISSYSLLTSQV